MLTCIAMIDPPTALSEGKARTPASKMIRCSTFIACRPCVSHMEELYLNGLLNLRHHSTSSPFTIVTFTTITLHLYLKQQNLHPQVHHNLTPSLCTYSASSFLSTQSGLLPHWTPNSGPPYHTVTWAQTMRNLIFEEPGIRVNTNTTQSINHAWERIRVPVVVPALHLAMYICIGMSIMLFLERIYMAIVIAGVKCFGRKRYTKYKLESVKEDLEKHKNYPMVLVQIPMFNEKEVHTWQNLLTLLEYMSFLFKFQRFTVMHTWLLFSIVSQF